MRWMILVLVFILSGCSVLIYDYKMNIKFSSINEANLWIHNNIKYKSDYCNYNMEDYWASPEETLNKMSGDCEDMSILLMSIIKNQFNIISELIVISYNNGYPPHSYVKINNNEYYDPVEGTHLNVEYKNNINYTWYKSYYDTMNIVYTTHHRY